MQNKVASEKYAIVIFSIFFSILYVCFFISVFDVIDRFPDLVNYMDTINYSTNMAIDINLILEEKKITDEPAWTLITVYLNYLVGDPLTTLNILSALSLFIFTFLIIEKTNRLYPIFFLFNPLIIDLVMSQTRSSLASSLFYAGAFSKHNYTKYVLIPISILIHSSMIVFFIIYIIIRIFSKNLIKNNCVAQRMLFLSLSFLICLFLSVYREQILSQLGDRRAEYISETGSLQFVLFWFFVSVYLVIVKLDEFYVELLWVQYLCIITFSIPLFMNMFSVNGVRFIALTLPLLLIMGPLFNGRKNSMLFFFLTSYQLLQFYYWLKF